MATVTSDPVTQIERARHLAHCFYWHHVVTLCKEEGIDELAVAEGMRLAGIDKSLRYEMCAIYGNPAYGSWPLESVEYKKKRFAELDQADRARRLKAMEDGIRAALAVQQ